MTKRTAALAAAAKISSSSSKARKVAKVGAGSVLQQGDNTGTTGNNKKKAERKKPAPASAGVATAAASKTTTTKSKKKTDASSSSSSLLPWYTVYTKSDPEYDQYMSTEWGYEKRGDKALFEKMCLEGAQSGLSWLTILRKREAYRKVFHNFEIDKVAKMTPRDVQRILDSSDDDPRNLIVRHRGKIEATINNAKCIQTMYLNKKNAEAQTEGKDDDDVVGHHHGIFDTFLWDFVQNKPILNTKWKLGQDLCCANSKTPESEAMSKALKKLGFRFVGPTTCYAMMQSVGMVIDHPCGSPEWQASLKRLQERQGGYQKDTDTRTR